MKVFQRAAALAVACACASQGAFGVDVVGGIGINYKNIDMSLEQDARIRPVSGANAQLDGRFSQDIAFDSWQPFLQANVAAIKGDYYVALNGEIDVMDEGSDIDVSQRRSPGLAINVASPYTETSTDIARHDLGITVGWRGIERVAIFAGFKYGRTDFDGDEASREFVTSGPLIGASYSLPFGAGSLTLGGAFARMSGTFDEDGVSAAFAHKVDGDANGFSAFVNWSAAFSERLRYLVELRWQRYDFDGSDSWICADCASPLIDPELLFVDQDFSVLETLYGVGVGLVYAL